MKFHCNSCDGVYSQSLDVRFTKKCDNNCPFCIEKQGICGMPTNVDKLIQSTIESGKETVLILGGEPLLEVSKVLKYVIGIRKYVKEIYLTTSLPKSILNEWETFCELMGYLDGLNVSLQHYSPNKNNEILHASSKHNRIELLSKICENEDFANKVRVSINLVKGAIDNKRDLDIFLCIMQEIHVKHVKINELQDSEDLYVSFEDIYGYKMKSAYAYGCQTDITLPYYTMRITLKRACFKVNNNLEATFMDFCKAFVKSIWGNGKKYTSKDKNVLYESGELVDGWKTK